MGREQSSWFGEQISWFWKSFWGQALSIGLLLVAFLVLFVSLWRDHGAAVTPGVRQQLTAKNIEITPPPAWLQSNVKEEAVVRGSLSGLTMRDPEVTLRLAQAFRLHPWVADVRYVSKRSKSLVAVELVYRQPAALVEVEEVNQDGNWNPGLFAIDRDCILLPEEGLPPQMLSKLPRIYADKAWPDGLPGTSWGDERIHDAARLIAILAPHWERMGLYRLTVQDAGRNNSDGKTVLALESPQRSTVKWGHTPGEESLGEPRAAVKLQRLADFIGEHGSLDAAGVGVVVLDLSTSDGLSVASQPK